MTIIAIVSQKGGSGKTTLSVNFAAAAEAAGAIALIIDTDPQATASQWGAWRADKPPEVIDSAPPRIQAKVEAAKAQGVGVDDPAIKVQPAARRRRRI
ncbi:cellulose biosynthesis protein BcsQ [Novosphingobium sp. SG707]|nr:cellulose biosynthesis protein BcsQ [Novosphingobium sp. SG707]